jgi:hypothetical protein
VAGTIRIKSSCSLKHQPNLGENVADIDLEGGTELQVLQTWESAWLAKDEEGRLFNVKKHLAEEV